MTLTRTCPQCLYPMPEGKSIHDECAEPVTSAESPYAYSHCVHCNLIIHQDAPGDPWIYAGLLGTTSTECDKRPNPDDGPMPPHEPGSLVRAREGLT